MIKISPNRDKTNLKETLMLFINKKIKSIALTSSLLIATCVSYSHNTFAKTQSISKVQQQIDQQKDKINQQKSQQEKLLSQLEQQEGTITKSIAQLKKIQQGLDNNSDRINEINHQIQLLDNKLDTQKNELGKLLDDAYRAGINPSSVQKALNERDQKSERLLAYYQAFNQQRLSLLQQIQASKADLIEQKASLDTQLLQQKKQVTQLQEKNKTLEKEKIQRQSTLEGLNRLLNKNQQRLALLVSNEKKLQAQIKQAQIEAEAKRNLAEKKAKAEAEKQRQKEQTKQEKERSKIQNQLQQAINKGLGRAHHQYTSPIRGRILHQYGSKQVGELRWKGIVIESPAGATVKAIAPGRVVLADRLQGYGLIVVIDHGKGDMSLYGYNQSLLVKRGQLVQAGEKIAEVGNSGGQDQNALYFEIRRRGKAINPSPWLK